MDLIGCCMSATDVPVLPGHYHPDTCDKSRGDGVTEWQHLSYVFSSDAILNTFELCLWQSMKTMKSKLRMVSADGAFPEAVLAVNTDAEM